PAPESGRAEAECVQLLLASRCSAPTQVPAAQVALHASGLRCNAGAGVPPVSFRSAVELPHRLQLSISLSCVVQPLHLICQGGSCRPEPALYCSIANYALSDGSRYVVWYGFLYGDSLRSPVGSSLPRQVPRRVG